MSTILIVEDDTRNMKLVRDVMNANGYSTLEATTGEEGVALAMAHRPDLVLMDIQLPGINGITAFRELRADPTTATIPVVAFTASVTPADRRRITEAGFCGLVSKPIELKEFLATLKRLLEGGTG